MILVGLLPPIGNFFSSLPESVLGGGTIMMFGTILTSGIEMIAKAGFNQRNVTIVALSLAVELDLLQEQKLIFGIFFHKSFKMFLLEIALLLFLLFQLF